MLWWVVSMYLHTYGIRTIEIWHTYGLIEIIYIYIYNFFLFLKRVCVWVLFYNASSEPCLILFFIF